MSEQTNHRPAGAIDWLRREYRKWRNFPWRFCLRHPAVFFRGVLTGPFAGTRLTLRTSWSQAANLLLGSYEKELHPVWERLITDLTVQPGPVWIIGAAEGYYACGLARRCPRLRVVAFEAMETSRKMLRRNLRKNGVADRVEIFAKCDVATFQEHLRRETPRLILSDIEGGENELFTERILASLPHTALVIEAHPAYELLARVPMLEPSHTVRVIQPAPRVLDDYPLKDKLPPDWPLRWMDELRPFVTPWIVAYPQDFGAAAP